MGKLILVSALITVFWISAAQAKYSMFDQGKHCVAYKTTKRLMLIRKVEVVGKNCDINSQVIPEVGGKYYVEMEVPISKFRSGESERDRDVRKLLKEKDQPVLVFRTKEYGNKEWQKLMAKNNFTIDGKLIIGKKSYPVTARVSITKSDQGIEVDGLVQTKFKYFGIDPPKIAAGLAAKVSKDLELHFHLMGNKTLGINSILPN